MITAKILTDSITDDGARLTTWELSYPRFIHSELMTHRVLSKNSASSRAIPASKLRERITSQPVEPVHWGAKQAGMQADREIDDLALAREWWADARDLAVIMHERGEVLGLHKQVVNRIIEPFMTITVICSGTDWANFFHLRNHKDAEPNFQALAKLMWDEYHNHTPEYLELGYWHLPLVTEDEKKTIQLSDLRKISTGRCARVSYLTHDGKRDIQADIDLHDRLLGGLESGEPGHMSPFEHIAVAVGGQERHGNFSGWRQYRKCFNAEAGPDTSDRCERCGIWTGGHTIDCPARR